MTTRLVRSALAVAGIVSAAAVLRRTLTSRSRVGRSSRDLLPVPGGDTWPPVPLNQNRQG